MDTYIKNKPEISVLMPAYNAEAYIAVAIQSVLDQAFQNFELIIIDDGSTDRTREIISSFTDRRIRLIVNKKNTGLSSVRNQAVRESSSELIAFLDSDDIALPKRLAVQKKFLDHHPNIGLLGTAVALINEKGEKTGVLWKSTLQSNEVPVALLFHNQFAQSSVMLRKDCLPGDVYREGYAPAEDYDLWVRIAKETPSQNLPNTLTLYRVHIRGSSYTQKEKQEVALKQIYRNQLLGLGVQASEEEVALHKKRFHKTIDGLHPFLRGKEQWLLRLQQSNAAVKMYTDEQFAQGVAREWFENCYTNARFGLTVWDIYKSSPLVTVAWRGKGWFTLKLFTKCVFRLS